MRKGLEILIQTKGMDCGDRDGDIAILHIISIMFFKDTFHVSSTIYCEEILIIVISRDKNANTLQILIHS